MNKQRRAFYSTIRTAVAESGWNTDDMAISRDPTMPSPSQPVLTTILLSVCLASARAADPAGLPEAFDAGWQGAKTCELLFETDEVRVGRCSFPPGIGHEKHYHVPHFGYVLEGGTLRIVNDRGEVEVRETITGRSWSTDEITVHSALNVGDTTTSYLIIEPKPALP